MLKVNFCMRKRSDRTLDQFSNYWREQHGPYAMGGRTTRLGMRRYVQNHLVVTPLAEPLARLAAPAMAPYEGICQIWFDGEDAVVRTRTSADGAAATQDLVEDERNFLDLPACAIRFYREECFVDGLAGSGAHKVVLGVCMRKAADAARLGAQVAEILTEGEAATHGVIRAVHNFGLDTPANAKLRAPRGSEREGFDYMLELWFGDYASLSGAVMAEDGLLARLAATLRAHGREGEMGAWIAAERIMIGGEELLAAAA